MDTTLHPDAYSEKRVFTQEGWRYELESEGSLVICNGVVCNETKSIFPPPESILNQCIQRVLSPDTYYGSESDGDSKSASDLTYEIFLGFHRTYYCLPSSFVHLYGDMNMAEKPEWLDEAYLSHHDKKEANLYISMQKPFTEPRDSRITYFITEDEPGGDASYPPVSSVAGIDLDLKLYLVSQILEYTLLDAPGASLK